jgi:SWI/SNF-related matrix-associated actin-dependent regulator of chromatin subfamily A3
MTKMYLYYNINIIPNDIHSGKIKKMINLEEITIYFGDKILKNENVYNYYKKINTYCPTFDHNHFNIYFVTLNKELTNNNDEMAIIQDYKIDILFVEVLNSELITINSINGPDITNKCLKGCIDRHIKIYNNLLDPEYFNYELDLIMDEISNKQIYNINNIKYHNNIVKTKLYKYQIDNINLMINLENNLLNERMTDNRLCFFEDGRIYDYTNNKLINFDDIPKVLIRGGILTDDVGIGKTLQMLCLSVYDLSNTLIIVPDHLYNHWNQQITIHLDINPIWVHIVTFSECINFLKTTNIIFNRLIIDEIHELYGCNNIKSNSNIQEYNNIWNLLSTYECKYKWGITATPFVSETSLFKILKYLTCNKSWNYQSMQYFKYLLPIYKKIFIRKLKSNILDFNLPNINIENILLDFNSEEKIIYNAEIVANNNSDEMFLRKACCDVIINFENDYNDLMTIEQFNEVVLKDFNKRYQDEYNKYLSLKEQYNNCIYKYEKEKNQSLLENIEHFRKQMDIQENIYKNRERSYNVLVSQLKNTECPICCCELIDNNIYDVTPCSHVYCHGCLSEWMKRNSSCPQCKTAINKDEIHKISSLKEIKLQYSSKINKLIELCKKNNEQLIIYTQFDILINKVKNILNKEGINTIQYNNNEDLDNFKNNGRVLILSSTKNASGLDLSYVSNIIILEPLAIDYTYLKDIEKQIIGRLHRINQKNTVKVYRLIIKDTIEEDIYKRSV